MSGFPWKLIGVGFLPAAIWSWKITKICIWNSRRNIPDADLSTFINLRKTDALCTFSDLILQNVQTLRAIIIPMDINIKHIIKPPVLWRWKWTCYRVMLLINVLESVKEINTLTTRVTLFFTWPTFFLIISQKLENHTTAQRSSFFLNTSSLPQFVNGPLLHPGRPCSATCQTAAAVPTSCTCDKLLTVVAACILMSLAFSPGPKLSQGWWAASRAVKLHSRWRAGV